jgi:2-phospho-L-lactate guanylyltransferase
LKTCVIIPVKTFSVAKTRLKLSKTHKEEICKAMLVEVLDTVSKSKLIDKIILVSKDETALKLGRQFNTVEIFDDESGVNHAVHLADKYILNNKYDRSVIFPQDIPIMRSSDIDNLLGFHESKNSVIIVPSRQLNGTNALVRCSTNIMKTQYDRGSYAFQLDAAKAVSQNVSVALIRRIMLDIDDQRDLTFMLSQNEKPDFCKRISNFQH